MSEQPKFLRDFSKQEHAEERNEMAAQIKEARAERRGNPEVSETAEKTVENYKELDTQVVSLQTNGVSRIKELFSWIGVKKRLGAQKTEAVEVSALVPEVVVPRQFEEPKKLLDDFYAREQQRWAEGKGSPEEMKQLFTSEHLASLSMDDYTLLLKRFPNAMVTHVTRQGIRDHTGMFEHTKGQGEYADGFMQILQEGELKSPLAVAAAENGKEAAIVKAIRLEEAGSKQEAEERLEQSLSGAFDGYADRAAVHVATEAVADHYYGSEKGNEVFLAFPSAHVASEHNFVGNLAQGRDLKNNDTWIVRDNNLDKGLDINAGVVFVPAEARVDAKTGSRYELDEMRRPVPNETVRIQINDLLSSPELMQYAKEDYDNNYRPAQTKENLKERFGIEDPRLQDAIASSIGEIRSLDLYQNNPSELERRKGDAIASVMERSGMRFKEAENTVSSQEFWENYFSQYPELRPSKLEYYKGDDPTAALLKWKEKHVLTNAGGESAYDLGGRINDVAEFQSEDKDRFKSIAQKIIDERFASEPEPQVVEETLPQPVRMEGAIPPPPPPNARLENESLEQWQERMRASFPPPPPPPAI